MQLNSVKLMVFSVNLRSFLKYMMIPERMKILAVEFMTERLWASLNLVGKISIDYQLS